MKISVHTNPTIIVFILFIFPYQNGWSSYFISLSHHLRELRILPVGGIPGYSFMSEGIPLYFGSIGLLGGCHQRKRHRPCRDLLGCMPFWPSPLQVTSPRNLSIPISKVQWPSRTLVRATEMMPSTATRCPEWQPKLRAEGMA